MQLFAARVNKSKQFYQIPFHSKNAFELNVPFQRATEDLDLGGDVGSLGLWLQGKWENRNVPFLASVLSCVSCLKEEVSIPCLLSWPGQL